MFADHAWRDRVQSAARRIRRFSASDPCALDRYVFEYAPPTCWRIQVAQGWRYILKRNLNDAHIPLAMNTCFQKANDIAPRVFVLNHEHVTTLIPFEYRVGHA